MTVQSMPGLDVRTSLALSKGAIIDVDFAMLADEAGVSLEAEKGNDHVIVLYPSRCCDHRASRTVPAVTPMSAMYDTSEHVITVAGCYLTMPGGTRVDALMERLPLQPHLLLTYGQVIALSGDFYGDPEHTVSEFPTLEERMHQFRVNFETLQAPEAVEEVKGILHITTKYEFGPIATRVRDGKVPSGAYPAIPSTNPLSKVMNDEDYAFEQQTNGRYLRLSGNNLDHFGEDAMKCYWAGHVLAQTKAREARKSPSPAEALKLAYAINAFADHFLTDLFAAGHMRTPRRKIYESEWKPSTGVAVGLCAKGMHDEDNKFGLWVANERGDRWVAYGDARYRDSCNSANRAIMKKALQQSMDDVWNAFSTDTIVKDPNGSVVFSYLPKIITEISSPTSGKRYRDDQHNWAPLFWWDPDTNNVNRRNNLEDGSERVYCEQGIWPSEWGVTTTAAQLALRSGPYMNPNQYSGAGFPYPPNEAGPSGEVGWTPEDSRWPGPQRPMHGYTGQDLVGVTWSVDGVRGPTN